MNTDIEAAASHTITPFHFSSKELVQMYVGQEAKSKRQVTERRIHKRLISESSRETCKVPKPGLCFESPTIAVPNTPLSNF